MPDKLLQGTFVIELAVVFKPLDEYIQGEFIGIKGGAGRKRWRVANATPAEGRA